MEERITLGQLQNILEKAKKDYSKVYDKNNKAATTRLRKSLQDVAKMCKVARKQAIEHKRSINK